MSTDAAAAALDIQERSSPLNRGPLARRIQPMLWGMGKVLVRLMSTRMFDLHTFGTRNIPAHSGALLISNHQSFLDPVLLAVNLGRQIDFMARANLFDGLLSGGLIRALNALPVRRGEADIAAIKEVMRRVTAGRIVTIFPEGTRTTDGEIRTILPGFAMIVRRAEVPVIPAVIDGSFEAWPRGQKLPRPHPIRIQFGRPMHLQSLKGREIVELIDNTLRTMLRDLRART